MTTTTLSPREIRRSKAMGADYVAPSPYSVKAALTKGDTLTKLSAVVFGLGNLARKQIVKGLLLLAGEIAFIAFMVTSGAGYLSKLPSLGTQKQGKVLVDGYWEYTAGDNSVIILLYGVCTIVAIIAFVYLWTLSLRCAYKAECLAKANGKAPSLHDDINTLMDAKAHELLMFLPTLGILVFTVLPLIFMISMAFTNYDHSHVVLFDWVGFDTFKQVFAGGAGATVNAQLFVQVLVWTLVWAFFATFLNFFFGMFFAMIINRKTTRFKGFWRAMFSMSIAVPQFVSLLVMRTMLRQQGIINRMLESAGLIDGPLPFLTDATWARVTVIVINLWIGIPYTIMQITGILQNIPADLYEAARIDGANWWQIFVKITMPYIFFVLTPYLITTFTGNVNNFNVIYLLTAGDPVPVGASAGKTDLLITWLYKLTVDKGDYNLGAVIGIMTFIVLAVVSLITYRSSGSYKNEEGFR
ncbi:sugar ABC transporter permease [Bifidobacterium amazonense]|uniref:Maltose/maltodextrin transport system permease protein n=1 Tax=Bifidobacterium amazonense TaxID=2809027 RepID=A0ABS9VWN5_9BIFI|nr:sugar ABC transporter permease [Bifidobacterium amazonense]MCH9276518.1 sugar ABC transporter permease [Bifidobacterium amazonense]